MKYITTLFLRGLMVLIPILLTAWFLFWLFGTAERLFRVPLVYLLPDGWYVRGLGVLSALAFTVLVGFLVKLYAFNLLFTAFEKLLNRLPLVKQVYSSIRDLIHFLGGSGREDLQKVVAIDFNGVQLIGFVTAEDASLDSSGASAGPGTGKPEKLLSVYLPMSYQVGGYLVYVPQSRCVLLDMPVGDAMHKVLTANIISNGDKRG